MAMGLGSFASRVVATKVVATDGTGDFTDIQSAIDDLPSTGGVVYIKEGTYSITSTITITSDNIALIGAGKATKIQAAFNGIILDIGTEVGLDETVQTGIFISQIYFFGNDQGGSTIGIESRTTQSKISDCWISDCNTGIEIRKGSDTIVSNCTVFDNNNDGISAVAAATAVKIIGCSIDTNSDKGITLSGTTNSIISHNTVRSNGGDGIDFTTNVDQSVISNNIVLSNGGDGISIDDNSDQCVIASNVSRANTGDEILIDDSTCNDTLVIGNNCKGGTITDNGTASVLANNIT